MTRWSLQTVLCDLVLALVINTSATLLAGAPLEFVSWYPGCAAALFTNVLLQLVLPVPGLAAAATSPLEGRTWRWVVSVFVENLVFVTCISLTMAYLNTAGVGLVEAWLATYPQLVGIGYATSVVLMVVGQLLENQER